MVVEACSCRANKRLFARALTVVLIAVVIAPAAVAQAPQWLEVDLAHVSTPDFVTATISTERQVVNNAETSAAPCPQSTISLRADASFIFREEQATAGCARLAITVEPPSGALRFVPEFSSNRVFELVEPTLVPGFEQRFEVRQSGAVIHRESTFTNAEPRSDISRLFAPSIEIGEGPLEVSWWFNDLGRATPGTDVVSLPSSFAAYRSDVGSVRFTFPGLPVEIQPGPAQSVAGSLGLDPVSTWDVRLEEPAAGFGHRMQLAYPSDYTLQAIERPDGTRLEGGELLVEEKDRIRRVSVDSSHFMDHESGNFRLVFQSAVVLQPSASLSATLWTLAAVNTIAFGVVLNRWFGSRRALRDIGSNADAIALGTLIGTVVAGSFVAAWLVVTDSVAEASSTPLSMATFVVGAYLAISIATMLISRQLLSGAVTAASNQRELERSNRDLDQFAHVVTHDLRAPLRTVSAFTTLLERQYGATLDDRAKEYIEMARGGATRMSGLLDAVSAYARVGRGQMASQSVDLQKALDDVCADLRIDLDAASARVNGGGLPTIRGEPDLVREVLLNLVQNAVKFRHPARKPVIHVSAARREQVVEVRVTDNGRGMSERQANHIFEPFQRAHHDKGIEGTGMGLAIVRRIVERHGGSIAVESQEGVGTTFILQFPTA